MECFPPRNSITNLVISTHSTPLPQGLGFPEIAVGGVTPPFQKLLDQGVVKEPVFSFWLNRDVEGQQGGELVLGGMDPAHFKGDHAW